jgi:hypothetical protein
MQATSRTVIKTVVWIAAGMIGIVVLHLGGVFALHVGQFSPLTGAFIGGLLTLYSAFAPRKIGERTDSWIGFEQLSWIMIGCGMLLWGAGESCWRYYVSIGQSPFPSIADVGYSSFPPLMFIGLLLLPRPDEQSRRAVLVLDSLISMGSILAIAWYLLLGSLAQAPGEASLAKFLGLYYPTSDTALLSCIIFLLLRGQGRAYQSTARRISLLVLGLGLCFFIGSDFIFNVQQNAGTYVEATWIDLGWPLGMMTIGIAAYLRRFLPSTDEAIIQERMAAQDEYSRFRPTQFVPYGLLGILFLALTLDVLSRDSGQIALRPVLLFATLGVIALVVVRQIVTLQDNMHLAQRQAEALDNLALAKQRIEEQSLQIAEHNLELERGIEHLRDVQASMANGNLRARASLTSGALLPLAGSLNLMAERLMRLEQVALYGQRVLRALNDLSVAFERATTGVMFIVPESCRDLTEIQRLLVALHVKGAPAGNAGSAAQPTSSPAPFGQPFSPMPRTPRATPTRAAATPSSEQASLAQRFPVTEPLSPRNSVRSYPYPTPPTEPEGQRSEQKVLGVRRPPRLQMEKRPGEE